jgi:non-ribosomal peptide synthetase component F
MIPLKSNIYNLYGPAECTIAALYHKVEAQPRVSSGITVDNCVPLGKTLLNRRAYVLDAYLQSTGINQVGELYLGGTGVFKGYLNRPDLTDAVLVQLPLYIAHDKRKYYKTGDLVKLNSEGKIIFVGRKDFQVKLRGQRIETGRKTL